MPTITAPCQYCHGSGRVARLILCWRCQGTGVVKTEVPPMPDHEPRYASGDRVLIATPYAPYAEALHGKLAKVEEAPVWLEPSRVRDAGGYAPRYSADYSYKVRLEDAGAVVRVWEWELMEPPAEPERKVRVIKLKLHGFAGPCVFRAGTDEELVDVLAEVRSLLDVEEADAGTAVTLTVAEMTEAEIAALPEFGGY